MNSSWKIRWACVNGPTLFHRPSPTQANPVQYEQNAMEAIPDLFLNTVKLIGNFLRWTCLFWAPWFVRSLLTENELFRCSRYLCYASLLYVSALALRGTGRYLNPDYRTFITLLKTCECKSSSESDLEQLSLFSFSSPWPANFDVRDLSSDCLKTCEVIPSRTTDISPIFRPLTWLLANTVGVYIAYPGSLSFTNSMTYSARIEARTELRNQYGVHRAGIRTRHGEFVEILYADRRGASHSPRESAASAGHGDSKGEILILCCEGNAGYPEIGIMPVPLQQGYSVVGWNHPGFGNSTGTPLPRNEQAAVEAVLLFAVHHLNFRLDQIVLFGWSIGGYAVTWAAMNYPEVAGVILDATFDNIDELAKKTLPSALYPFVLATIRDHIDLNNMSQLIRYDGPVRLIRRTFDEIISTGDGTSWASNRGNQLLVGLLKHRYPHLMTEENEEALWNFLSRNDTGQEPVIEGVDFKHYSTLVTRQLNAEALGRQSPAGSALTSPSVVMPTTNLFPSELGSQTLDENVKRGMLFYLVSEHFVEYHSTHCTALASELFRLPWSPFSSSLSELLSARTPSAESVADEYLETGGPAVDNSNDSDGVVLVDGSQSM